MEEEEKEEEQENNSDEVAPTRRQPRRSCVELKKPRKLERRVSFSKNDLQNRSYQDLFGLLKKRHSQIFSKEDIKVKILTVALFPNRHLVKLELFFHKSRNMISMSGQLTQ